MGDENKILKRIPKKLPMLPVFFISVSRLLIQPPPPKNMQLGSIVQMKSLRIKMNEFFLNLTFIIHIKTH